MAEFSAKSIKHDFDAAVADYIEGRDGIGRLVERIGKLDNAKVFAVLTQAGQQELIALITIAADAMRSTSQPSYNPKDTGSVQRVLQGYYNSLKNS